MLCDCLVCGINDSRIQCRLLAEPDLDYKKAYELALALEAAEKSAQDLQANPSNIHFTQRVGNKTSRKVSPTKLVVCHRCGGPHKAPDCSFQKSKCHKCGKVGHLPRCVALRLPYIRLELRNSSIHCSQMNILQILNQSALSTLCTL